MPSRNHARRLVFKGTHPKLQTGMEYTIWEYAVAAGRDYKRLHHKLSRYEYVSDKMLEEYIPRPLLSRLETSSQVYSQAWLSKPLRS